MNETLTASPDPFTSSLTGRKLGRYEVLARLASGGMAGVYVARAIGVAGFERLFAIKVLHPHLAHEEEFISMFLDEARLAARIRHPNVVPTIDISDTPDAGFYLVMEYIEGDHLGALLQRAWKLGVRMPWPITLRVIVDALEGLAAAHNLTDETGRRLNLVHRDISPHNIMVSTDGIARITDFGVAKAEVRLSTTREGQFKGKLAYMAPEHASSGDADQRSDLFSMAIILWECLTGQRLFRAENHAATLNKICLEPIPMPSSVDPDLAPFDFVLERGLARDPEQRFQSAEEFAEALEHSAHILSGIAKQREVAQVVREYAAEKIAHDAGLIRTAIAQIANDVAAAPEPAASRERLSRVDPRAPTPVPAVLPPATPVVAPPPALGQDDDDAPEEPKAGRAAGGESRWIWVSVVFLLAAAVGLFLAFSKPGTERVRSVRLAVPTAPAATAAQAAPAPPAALPVEPTAPAAAGSPAMVAAPEVPPPSQAQAPASAATAVPADGTTVPAHATTSTHKHSDSKEPRHPKGTAPAVPKAAPKSDFADDGLMLNPYRH